MMVDLWGGLIFLACFYAYLLFCALPSLLALMGSSWRWAPVVFVLFNLLAGTVMWRLMDAI